jgi:hypothetical protein
MEKEIDEEVWKKRWTKLVEDAAEAIEIFGEDELEEYAKRLRRHNTVPE